MGNTFGELFRVTTFGESHSDALGAVIDGCPAGLEIETESIERELNRRKPGQSALSTSRREPDRVEILSGIFEGASLGTPISMIIRNKDADPGAYENIKDLYRPGHADYTYEARYGVRDWRGGGRASARETVARVAAGAIAKKLVYELGGIEILAWVEQIHNITAEIDIRKVSMKETEENSVRCPDQHAARKMAAAILKAQAEGDSLGGKVRFRVRHCPPGLGEPVFGKLSSDIARACMSIPAVKSVSLGMGEESAEMTGEQHNDPFTLKKNRIRTSSNFAGGMLGGISNGETIYGLVSFKPIPTISKTQTTISRNLEEVRFQGRGRHDPCAPPRAVPVVEAMLSLVAADHLLKFSIASMKNLKKIFSWSVSRSHAP